MTSHIGLISTATTTYLDPFHVARMFATLDQMSEGRVGWNVVTSSAASEALNFSHQAHAPHDHRYERAAEFIAGGAGPVGHLGGRRPRRWTRRRGCSSIPTKLHLLHHKGKHFQVRGPLMVPRSPQGQPVIVQAGQSEAGLELAARTAEVLFTVSQNLDNVAGVLRRPQGAHRAVRPLAGFDQDHARRADGGRDAAATKRKEKFERLQALIHPELGVAMLSDIVGLDLSKYPLDGPLPDVPLTNIAAGPPEGRDGHGAARRT